MKSFDERDTLFSRIFELKDGTERYKTYYQKHPYREEIDEKLREENYGVYSSDILSQKLVHSTFDLLKDLRVFAHRDHKNKQPTSVNKKEIYKRLETLAKSYGAALFNTTKMSPDMYYSYRGRGDKYGEERSDNSPTAIVFAVEMSNEELQKAPTAAESVEVVNAYTRVAMIGLVLSYYIRELGYKAYTHMDGETTLPMIPVAQVAGLGEIGRMGLLINRRYGARIRIGVITTDLPIEIGEKENFNLKNVCEKCGLCAKNCPNQALDTGSYPWRPTDDQRCFTEWKKQGTDCGICLISCPYSKP